MWKKIALIVLCGLVMLGIRGTWAQQQVRTEEKKTESKYQEPDRGLDNQMLQEKTVSEQTETQEQQVNASSDTPVADDKTQGGSVSEAGETFAAAGDNVIRQQEPQGEEALQQEAFEYEKGYIFVGDSRFYLMNEDCGIEEVPNFFVVSCPGMGYRWLVLTALPKVSDIQKQHPEIERWAIICGLGVNDLSYAASYVRQYTSLSEDMELWLLSVNPTGEGAPSRCGNDRIEAFNRELRQVSGAKYIDSYSYLKKLGYRTASDGVHYDSDSNWAIYAYILEQLYREVGNDPVNESECEARASTLERKLSQEYGR